MDKARRHRRIYLTLGVVISAAFLILAALTLLLLWRERYVIMAVTFVLSVISAWFGAFLFFAAQDARDALLLLQILSEKDGAPFDAALDEASAFMGWKRKAVDKLLRKCIKKKYFN